MSEKGRSTVDMKEMMVSPPVSYGLHASPNVAPLAQPQQVVTAGGVGSANADLVKRRRGRPLKIDAAGNSMEPLVSAAASPPVMTAVASPAVMSVVAPPPEMSSLVPQVVSETTAGFLLCHLSVNSANRTPGRGHGRPQGSGNLQVLASVDSVAKDFRPHVIDVYPGEDVIVKIMSLTHGGPRGVCVLSANGIVGNVALHDPCSSGGVIVYQGQFEILSLTGSCTISEVGGMRRTGGFTVSLAGPQGQVIGGGVAGPLVAASPVQTVVGSFMPNACNYYKRKQQAKAHGNIHRDGNRADEPAEQRASADINMTAADE